MRVLRRLAWILPALVVISGGVLDAKTKKGDKLLVQGNAAEKRQEWDKALEFYEQAMAEDPADPGYQIPTRRVRFQASQQHLDKGKALRREGKVQEALAAFEKAYAIDPSSSVAEQELRRTIEMIEREKKKGAEAKPEERGLTSAELAQKQELEKIASIRGAPELRPLSTQPINLKMANQPARVLFETVGKLAGINIVFDPDYRNDPNASRPQSIELINSTLEEALDHLAAMTKAYWKPLSANTIFITSDNQAKRRDYEDHVVKVFYLSNLTTPQELQEVSTTLRSITDIRRVFVYNSQNAVILRGTTDQVALAEKLINDLDKPKAEVVVDVLVMEANRSKSRDLAATIASGGAAGVKAPILFTPRNPVLQGGKDDEDPDATPAATTTSTSQLISLARIARISTNDFSITLPGALLNFVMSDRQTKVLQSPQVRAANGQKASLRIGDKVPVASGGMQPFGVGTGGAAGGGYGYGGLYSQFQFIDVGVNVDITPVVHGEEVTLKVELEISNVRDRVDLGGISQPVIGQRKVTHEIRIKEGEVSLLGGLMQLQDTKTVSGVPGLASIPIVRRLFSSESIEKGESELLIALVPHIVRTPGITDLNLKGVISGTEAVVKLNYAPRRVPVTADATPGAPAAPVTTPAAPAATPGAPAPSATPGAPAPSATPTPSPRQAAPAVPGFVAAEPEAPAVPQPAPPSPQPPPAGASLMMSPAVINAAAGSTFTVQLEVQNVQDLFAAPFHMKFDPQILRLTEVRAGQLLSGDGKQIIFTRNILNDTGDLTVNLNRMPDSGGMSGSGALATFTFQAVKPGSTTVTFPNLALRNSQSQPIPAAPPAATVNIK